MVTARSIPSGVQREIERAYSSDHVLIFLRLSSPQLDSTVDVVSDPKNHVYDGDTYVGFEFNITLLTDDDQPPTAQLQIQNVDRIIGETLRKVTEPIRAAITVIAGSEFNNSVDPRVELGTSAVMYSATDLYLVDVEVTALTVTGSLRLWDYSQEQWPSLMSTEDRLPGLFR